jgi:hypothetical protein
MPAVNPRITITLKPEVHAMLRRLSELTGNSQSAMVAELLDSSQPVFERMVTLLEAAARLKAEGMQAPDAIRSSLDRAQDKLETQLGLALEAFDQGGAPLLKEAEKVTRRAGRGGPARGEKRPARKAPTPISNRGVTPHGKTLRTSQKTAPAIPAKRGRKS